MFRSALICALLGLSAAAQAQSYPSPIFNSVTVPASSVFTNALPTVTTNNVVIGTTSPAWPMHYPAAIQVGPQPYTASPTGSLNMGLDIVTNPGNIPYDAADTGYRYWNLIAPVVSTYWPGTPSFNLGLFIDARMNPNNTPSTNGSMAALDSRLTVAFPPSPATNASFGHAYIGSISEVYLPRGDSGASSTVTGGPYSGTSITVADATGFLNQDSIYVILDSGKYQHFVGITVSGNTITLPNALVSPVSAGKAVHDAKGYVYARQGVASVGSTSPAIAVLEVTDAEEDINVPAGSSVLYKSILTLAPMATDAVHGSIIDAMISLSAANGAVGFNDGILFHAFNGGFPISSTGGLMRVDGTTIGAPWAIGYGIDMSWATIAGPAFGFSTTGVGTPDNYWSNATLRVTGGITIAGAPAVGIDEILSTGTIAMRMANNHTLVARNAANSGNFPLLQLDATNVVVIGSASSTVKVLGVPTSAGAGGLFLCVDSAGAIYKKATCP